MRYTDLIEGDDAVLNVSNEQEVAGMIDEGIKGDWAILPATMELYGKRVVDVYAAASEWEPGPTTILICSKVEKDGRRRYCFVASCGDSFDYFSKDVGKEFSTYHDQTLASKGFYRIENVVVIQNGEMVKCDSLEGVHVKASLAVFK